MQSFTTSASQSTVPSLLRLKTSDSAKLTLVRAADYLFEHYGRAFATDSDLEAVRLIDRIGESL